MIRFIMIKNFLIETHELKWEKNPIVKKEKILYHIQTMHKISYITRKLENFTKMLICYGY